MYTPKNQAIFNNPIVFDDNEASSHVKKPLYRKKVKLEFDKDSLNSFGSTLEYLYLEDVNFLNDKLVKSGYSKAM